MPDDAQAAAIQDPEPLALRPGDCVVAAQGRRDLDALEAALLSPAAYVGMVTSRRKAAMLVDRPRAEGVDDACRARLASAAGLDLGRVDPAEIAFVSLATMVHRKNRDHRAGQTEPTTLAQAAPLWPVLPRRRRASRPDNQ